MELTYFPSPQDVSFISITNRKLSYFQKPRCTLTLSCFLLLWLSTLQLLSLICSSGEEILNITSSQQRLDNNYQQMAGSRVLRERERNCPSFQNNLWETVSNLLATILVKIRCNYLLSHHAFYATFTFSYLAVMSKHQCCVSWLSHNDDIYIWKTWQLLVICPLIKSNTTVA